MMRRICLTVGACVLMLVSASKAQATDEFIAPESTTISVGYYDLLYNGNVGTIPCAGIFDSGVDRFELYEVVSCVPQLVDYTLTPDFDSIDQYSWNSGSNPITYTGWYIGGVYNMRAYDSGNNLLDAFEITIYDDTL